MGAELLALRPEAPRIRVCCPPSSPQQPDTRPQQHCHSNEILKMEKSIEIDSPCLRYGTATTATQEDQQFVENQGQQGEVQDVPDCNAAKSKTKKEVLIVEFL
uniref:Uncharacterized protein n=1 Tax=Arundo donax TaxID=35708 RepID=A0A0A9BID1_ARUDO